MAYNYGQNTVVIRLTGKSTTDNFAARTISEEIKNNSMKYRYYLKEYSSIIICIALFLLLFLVITIYNSY